MKSDLDRQPLVSGPIFHLVTQESRGKPLCGEASASVLIGSYVEHLDTTGAEVRWVREVFGPNSKPVRACERCLDLYPSELKRIVPFAVIVSVQFEPDKAFSGYAVSADAYAQIGDRREVVNAYPSSRFITAKRLHRIQFEIELLADSIVPWVNQANKG